jgi:hypothetical protein
MGAVSLLSRSHAEAVEIMRDGGDTITLKVLSAPSATGGRRLSESTATPGGKEVRRPARAAPPPPAAPSPFKDNRRNQVCLLFVSVCYIIDTFGCLFFYQVYLFFSDQCLCMRISAPRHQPPKQSELWR